MSKRELGPRFAIPGQRTLYILVAACATFVGGVAESGSGSGEDGSVGVLTPVLPAPTPARTSSTLPTPTSVGPTVVNVIVEAPSASSLPASFLSTTLSETIASLTCKYGTDAEGDKLVPGGSGSGTGGGGGGGAGAGGGGAGENGGSLTEYNQALVDCADALAVSIVDVRDSIEEPSLPEGQLNIRLAIGLAAKGVTAQTVAAAFESAPDTAPGYWLLNTMLVRIADAASLTTTPSARTLSANNAWSTTTTTTGTTTTIYATGVTSLWSEMTLSWVVITAIVAILLVGGVYVFCKYERHTHMQHAEEYLQQLHRAQNPWIAPEYKGVQLAIDSPTKVVEKLIGLDSAGHIIPGGPRDTTNESTTEDNVAVLLNQPPLMDPTMVEQMTVDILARVKSSEEFAAFTQWQADASASASANAMAIVNAKAISKAATPAVSVAPTIDEVGEELPCRYCQTVGGHLSSCQDHPKNKTKTGIGSIMQQRRGSTAPILSQGPPDWLAQLANKQKQRRASQASLQLGDAGLGGGASQVSGPQPPAPPPPPANVDGSSAHSPSLPAPPPPPSDLSQTGSSTPIAQGRGTPASNVTSMSMQDQLKSRLAHRKAQADAATPTLPAINDGEAGSQLGSVGSQAHYYPPNQGELKTAV